MSEDIGEKQKKKKPKASAAKVACRVCGENFTTKKMLTRIQEQLNLPEELAETCPKCRGTEFRKILEKSLVRKNEA